VDIAEEIKLVKSLADKGYRSRQAAARTAKRTTEDAE
jgi:hypothetical protein